MSKYVKVDPSEALDPTPHMRIVGRGPSGRMSLIVVHFVERGCVHYRWFLRGHPGLWPIWRMELEPWRRSIRGEDGCRVVAVRVPNIQPGSDEP